MDFPSDKSAAEKAILLHERRDTLWLQLTQWLSLWRTVALLVMLASLSVVWHYRYHFWWWYESKHHGLRNVQPIPNHSMPDTPTPKGWIRCRVGSIEFSVPPELAGGRSDPKAEGALVKFQNGDRSLIVAMPKDENDLSRFLKVASDLCPHRQSFTLPRLRLACYEAGWQDFRWSMTPKEVRWHAFCMIMSNLMRFHSDGYTESLFRQDLDGIVHFFANRAVFDWQTADGRHGGYMHFVAGSEKIDPAWVRTVCCSLRVFNDVEADNCRSSVHTTATADRP